MTFVAFLLAGILAFGAAAEAPQHSSQPGEVFPLDFPDPMVIHEGGVYYAYGTETPWQQGGVFPILRSTDLHSWRYVGDAMPVRPAWAVGDMWAPNVVVRGGTYFLYYSAAPDRGYGDHCVAVATANSPLGPFTDRGQIACVDGDIHGFIDPNVVLAGGAGYLYFSVDVPYHSISVLPLDDQLLHAAGPRTELLTVSQSWEVGSSYTTVEGPFVVEEAGTYYLFYSANDWKHDYAMGYATSASPLGPFLKSADNPVLRGGPEQGPGGGSLFRAGQDWMLAYHAWGTRGRTLHVTPICVDGGRLLVRC